jgi:hypothetical protein
MAATKISGYRELTETEIDLINFVKERGSDIAALVDQVGAFEKADPRWVQIARTDLQRGFMALTRAIAKPEGF